MSYQTWSVVYGEQPSATKWNILGQNDESFNDGTGIGNGAITLAKLASDVLPSGIIFPFASASIPSGWLLCDGSAVSRATYAALFSAISTNYGVGNGSSTFNLPDLRGKVPVGLSSDTEFNTLGKTGGAKTHTLSATEMPSHTHTGTTSTDGSHVHSLSGKNNLGADTGSRGVQWAPELDTSSAGVNAAGSHNHSFTTASAGGGQAHNNLQPYQVTNFIIKT